MSRIASQIRQAVNDPGSIATRDNQQEETFLDWQVRAVLTVLVDGRYIDGHPGPGNPLSVATLLALTLAAGLILGWVLL